MPLGAANGSSAALQLTASEGAACAGPVTRHAAPTLLPQLAAVCALPFNLIPTIVQIGKSKYSGKNKRIPKKANHGARPCSHVMRRRRAAVHGRIKHRHR